MPDPVINEAAFAALREQAQTEAVRIVAQRIVDDATTITRRLSTRPPSRREWGYSLPRGRLAGSIRWEAGHDGFGPYADIGVGPEGIPLARFQGFGGRPAYGGSRAHRNSMRDATEMQIGRPVP